jgi:hypothetical protein
MEFVREWLSFTLSNGNRHPAPYWQRRAWGRMWYYIPYIYRHTPYRPPPLHQGLGSWIYGISGFGSPWSRVSGLHGLGSSPMVTGHMVTLAFGSLGLSGHWSRVSLWLWSLLGHGLGSNQQPRVEPRVKPLAHGQSQANSPGSRPQTRAKPNYPGHGSGSWVKPPTQGLSPGSNPSTRVKTIDQGHGSSPGSNHYARVKGTGLGSSPGSSPSTRVYGLGSPWSQTQHQLPCAHIWVFGSGAHHNAALKVIKL